MAKTRPWLTATAQAREAELSAKLDGLNNAELAERLVYLSDANSAIHDRSCINLNPAANVMNPKATAALGANHLSTRPSLGHAGEKYETGLEAVEAIEHLCHELCCRVFEARFAEVRMLSGAMSNLTTFMALCRPGDAIVVPPASIGGHVTHNEAGAAGLFGLQIHEAAIDADTYSIDVAATAEIIERVKPKLVTVGQSLNIKPAPITQLAEVAHSHGAKLMFDAAHACGLFAGRAWPNPLSQGADVMTLSTYKSLGGPAGGLIVTNDAEIAAAIDAVAYPGLTANSDAGRVAALAITMLDWLECGQSYVAEMISSAQRLAKELQERGLSVYLGGTDSHQLAVQITAPEAPNSPTSLIGGLTSGDAAARKLRKANLLVSEIGLPTGSGIRLGTPEAVRWGMTASDMAHVAGFIAEALHADSDDLLEQIGERVASFRASFDQIHFVS